MEIHNLPFSATTRKSTNVYNEVVYCSFVLYKFFMSSLLFQKVVLLCHVTLRREDLLRMTSKPLLAPPTALEAGREGK